MPPLQRPRPVQLHRPVDDILRGLGREQLPHRHPPGHVRATGVVRGGRRTDHQPSRLDPHRHLGDLVGHSLEVPQLAAERVPLGRPVEGRVQCGLRHPDGKGTDTRPEPIERPHRDTEPPAGLPDDVLGPDGHTVEGERPNGMRRQHVEGLTTEPGPIGGHEKRGDATRPRLPGTSEHRVEVGLGSIGDPTLLPHEPPATPTATTDPSTRIRARSTTDTRTTSTTTTDTRTPTTAPIRYRPQPQRRRIRPRPRLAQRERRNHPPRPHPRQPPLPLTRTPVPMHGIRPQPLKRERGLRLGAAVRQRLPHLAEFDGAVREQPFQQAPLTELGDKGTVDPAGLPLLRERTEDFRGQCAQVGTPHGVHPLSLDHIAHC
ncbi:hypothetical protein Saa2_02384 [Streptomyces acidiscabies]|nr:hypothetical protein Saa2_02384 [Streptomyces acidiscabies]